MGVGPSEIRSNQVVLVNFGIDLLRDWVSPFGLVLESTAVSNGATIGLAERDPGSLRRPTGKVYSRQGISSCHSRLSGERGRGGPIARRDYVGLRNSRVDGDGGGDFSGRRAARFHI